MESGATAYFVSAAESMHSSDTACRDSRAIARPGGLDVMMASGVSPVDDFVTLSHSSAWPDGPALASNADAEAGQGRA
jgi:hypothetical protein